MLDPLHGAGYQFWSGIGGHLFVLTGLVALIRKHHCHAKWCWRLGNHQVDGTPYKVCRKHHPSVPNRGASAEHIRAAHSRQKRRGVYGDDEVGVTTQDDVANGW